MPFIVIDTSTSPPVPLRLQWAGGRDRHLTMLPSQPPRVQYDLFTNQHGATVFDSLADAREAINVAGLRMSDNQWAQCIHAWRIMRIDQSTGSARLKLREYRALRSQQQRRRA